MIILASGCNVTTKTTSLKIQDKTTIKTDTSKATTAKSSESIERSITYLSVQDSASIKALLECDSLGNVHIKEITELKAGLMVKPSIKLVDNYITTECKVDSFLVYKIMKLRFDTIQEKIEVKTDIKQVIQEETKEEKSTTWQIGPKLTIGGPIGLLVILAVLVWYAKRKKLI